MSACPSTAAQRRKLPEVAEVPTTDLRHKGAYRLSFLTETHDVTRIAIALADQFNLARPPLLAEEGLKRAVKAKDCKPTLARHGLYPVAPLSPRRLGRAKVNRGRTVSVRLSSGRRKTLAAGAGITLRRVEHRAGLVVINRE